VRRRRYGTTSTFSRLESFIAAISTDDYTVADVYADDIRYEYLSKDLTSETVVSEESAAMEVADDYFA